MRLLLLLVTLLAGLHLPASAEDAASATIGLESRPDGITSAWPYVRSFYAAIAEKKDVSNEQIFQVIPDQYKLDFIAPLLLFAGGIGVFIVSILFLVKEFQVHWGWGVGQLLANAASFLFIVPGFVVALIFLIMHWHKAFNVFVLGVLFWVMIILSVLMIPSWAPTAAGLQMMKP